MREIVLDTETTGLDPKGGDRIVEIGCIELVNHLVTGRTWQHYINPDRDMPPEAFAVHGLSAEFLLEHPQFDAVAGAFLEFIGESPLIIHNVPFDMGFLNAELARCDKPALSMTRCIDTVPMARKKFPGAQVNLDALCRRFQIDLSARQQHGALLDAELLSEVYLELIGGRQPDLKLAEKATPAAGKTGAEPSPPVPGSRTARAHGPAADEIVAHEAFVDTLKNPIWRGGGSDEGQ